MFSQVSVCPQSATRSLLDLVTARSLRILLEYCLVIRSSYNEHLIISEQH